MTFRKFTGFRVTGRMWQATLLLLSVLVIALTFWCLTQGITTIFMHLYYFPIVLLAYRYRWKGFGLATLLALVYLGLVMVFDTGQWDVILGAAYRFLVFAGIAAVIAYLSEQLAAEKRTSRESTEIRGQYISLAPAIILVLDPGGAITFLNNKGGEILECTPDEIIGKSWFDQFLPEHDRERVRREFSQMVTGQIQPDEAFENQVLTRGGTKKIIRWNNAVLHDEGGAITGILGFGEDVTEERQVQDTLRNMQQFQESVIANANIWISVLAPDGGTLLIWNDAAEAISGYKKSAVVGKNTVWKQLYPDKDYRRNVTGEIQRILRKDDFLENFETMIRCADGTKKTIVWNTRGQRDNSGAITSYIAIGRDVTAQKSAELRAGESSRFLAAMIDALPIPVFFKDAGGKYLGCNPPFEEYLGITLNDLIGKTAFDISPKDLAEKYTAADHQVFANPVPQHYETQAQYADGSRHDVIFYKAPFFNKDGSVEGLIGALIDISERKLIEEALQESENRYRTLMQNAPAMVYRMSLPDGRYEYISPASLEITGYTPEEILRTPMLISERVHPEFQDYFREQWARLIAGEVPPVYEYKFIPPEGEVRWLHQINTLIRDDGGRPVALEGIVTDITDRKRVEEALILSEQTYRSYVDNSPEGIFVVDNAGHYLDVNRAACELLGYSRNELLSMNISDLALPGKKQQIQDQFIDIQGELRTESFVSVELFLKKKDGSACPVILSVVKLPDNTIMGFTLDITDRKQAEEALERSHAVLKSVIESPKAVVIFALDQQYRYIAFNENHRNTMKQIWGVDIALGISMPECITSPDDRKKATDNFDRALSGESFTLVEAYGDTALERRWFENAYNPITDQNDHVVGLTLFLTDVTERKRMEQDIIDSRQLFVNIISFLPDPTLVIDDNGRVLAWNRALEQLSGVSASDIIGKGDYEYSLWQYKTRRPLLIDLVLRPDLDIGELDYTDLRWEGNTVTAQTEVISPVSGKKISISLVASPLIDLQGKVTGAIESLRDISGIKAAETALARLNANLEQIVKERTQTLQDEVVQRMQAEKDVEAALDYTRSVIEANPDLVVVLDETGIILDVNAAGERLTGIAKEQLIGTPYFGYLVEDGTVQSAFAGLLQEGMIENLVRIRHTNGHVTPLSVHATVIRGMDGTHDQIIVAAHDITRQKQDEEAIRSSQQMLTNILENFPGVVFWKDTNSVYLGCNRNFSDGAGLKDPAEIAGKTDFDLPWAKTEAESYRSFDREVMDEGKARLNIIETQLQSDGRSIWLDTSKVPLFGLDGTVIGILGTSHDITRQKHDEEAIKASLEEKVLLLREVHHRVKNNLQIIISLTNLQMRTIDDPRMKQVMAETRNRVRAMSLVHEKLYLSENISSIDLADYTKFLATQLFSFYGVDYLRVALKTDIEKIPLDIDTAIPLGLVLNELISNALKHAFPDGRNGTLSISSHTDRDVMTVIVEDDGVGMPAGYDWKNSESLGLRLVNILVDQLGGTIAKGPGEGTMFIITLHRKPNRESDA